MPERKYPRNRLRELFGGRLREMPGAMELLEKMLVLDPRKRITAMQAVYSVRKEPLVVNVICLWLSDRGTCPVQGLHISAPLGTKLCSAEQQT